MSDETNVNAGSETSGEQAADTTVPTETAATDTGAPASQEVAADQNAGGAADEEVAKAASEPKTGDSCVCPDGRAGTFHVLDEGLVCLPNQG